MFDDTKIHGDISLMRSAGIISVSLICCSLNSLACEGHDLTVTGIIELISALLAQAIAIWPEIPRSGYISSSFTISVDN